MELPEVKEFIESINIPKNEVIFLHVKLKGISDKVPYQDLAKHIIEVLEEAYKPKTILIPTFTYSYTKTGNYNRISSSSEVGRFSEEIRKEYNFSHRTLNPVFNVIDTNKYFEEYDLIEESSFGEDSLMHLLHIMGHVVVNINVDEFISTYLHFLEYHYRVPYRYIKKFPGEVIVSNKERKDINYEYYVRDLDKNTQWDREKIKLTLHKEGGLNIYKQKNVEINWSHSKAMERILGRKLEVDKNFLLQEVH